VDARSTDELAALAEAAAREAGALLRDAFAHVGDGTLEAATKSSPSDLVSEADVAAERRIREHLLAARPADGFMGEEGGSQPGDSGVRWVVDPLDGTTNFLFGVPHWGISVGCEDDDGPLAGAVYDPLRDELWAATRDGPATLHGVALDPPPERDVEAAVVATGFSADAGIRALQAESVLRLLPEIGDLRRLGSAALDLAWTAAGRFDAYYERGVKPWDVAAGALVCARAGLEVWRLEESPPSPAGLLVAHPALAARLAGLIG
jgi:myo-inositol-1(or 4)-monophosphatase